MKGPSLPASIEGYVSSNFQHPTSSGKSCVRWRSQYLYQIWIGHILDSIGVVVNICFCAMRAHILPAVLAYAIYQLTAEVWAYTPLLTANQGSWASVQTMFIFGDSWSDTSFNLSGPQPGPATPLGNPPYPGDIATNGAKWPVYLTTHSNSSAIETYNLARSCSTVDSSIIPHGDDFVSQVQNDFLPRYGLHSATSWQPSTTLFVIYFGINDIGVAQEMNTMTPTTFDAVFVSYSSLVDQLYQSGARNFLFLNVPPMDRAPSGLAAIKPAIADWNTRLAAMASDLSNAYSDANVFEFDTHGLITKILDEPASFPQTALYKNTTDAPCRAYWGVEQVATASDPGCPMPFREYMWYDNWHPTYPTHEVLAEEIAKTLSG